jgi:hypothetical protein
MLANIIFENVIANANANTLPKTMGHFYGGRVQTEGSYGGR